MFHVRVRPKVDNQGAVSPDLPFFGDSFVIEAPEVIPNVMLILVFYFTYRYAVEWFQSAVSRRDKLASRVDASVSALLSVSATLVFAAQRISLNFQLSDVVTAPRLAILGFAIICFAMSLFLIYVAADLFVIEWLAGFQSPGSTRAAFYAFLLVSSLPAWWAVFSGDDLNVSGGIGGLAALTLTLWFGHQVL